MSSPDKKALAKPTSSAKTTHSDEHDHLCNAPKRIVFFQVRNSQTKIARIVEIAHLHFAKKERLIFFVEDTKSEQFVDELLWKSPPYSFLPHIISDVPCEEWVVISKTKENVNQARYAFNLCPTPLLVPFAIVYDFEDLTNPNKQALSQVRYNSYRQNHFLIEARV